MSINENINIPESSSDVDALVKGGLAIVEKYKAIAQAKIYIPKCGTCKNWSFHPAIDRGRCIRLYKLDIAIDFYCAFHEPKPE